MTQVSWDLATVPHDSSVVTIGVFDGVHRGHQALLARVRDEAAGEGLRSVAITFDRNPIEVVRPGHQPAALQPLEAKLESMAASGIDLIHVLTFDVEASQETAEDFVARVLAGPLATRQLLVGRNFRFGHRAAGDVAMLEQLGPGHGFKVEAIELVDVDGVAVSSTAIRQLISSGDVATAAVGLGRPHRLTGPVVRGDGRGGGIGIPTANVAVPVGLVMPAIGVYATVVVVAGQSCESVTNVGVRPTFGGGQVTVEAHLLDDNLDLYGRLVSVDFIDRLRSEQRFDGVDALVAQIRADIVAARAIFD